MKKKTLPQMFAQHEEKDSTRFSELKESIEKVHTALPENIVKAVKETVNGKIDKANNNMKWMMLIGGFLIPVVLAAFAWSVQWEIQTSNQVAGANASLQVIEQELQTKP